MYRRWHNLTLFQCRNTPQLRFNGNSNATGRSTNYSQRTIRRLQSTNSHSTPSNTSRLDKLIARTPNFSRPHLLTFRNAPVTHITSFLILHELTAIIPLFGLVGGFHYYEWLPSYFLEGADKWVGLFTRWFKRRGWISEEEELEVQQERESDGKTVEAINKNGSPTTRIIVEFATAYAIVKAFMPLRLVVSAWMAPWFARWTVVPVGNLFRRVFGQKKQALQ